MITKKIIFDLVLMTFKRVSDMVREKKKKRFTVDANNEERKASEYSRRFGRRTKAKQECKGVGKNQRSKSCT